ncbi:MAG: recombinase family protein [Candidatus Hodarchaeota archaeon]
MNKCIFYFRVSTKAQEEEGYNLDAQKKILEKYAKEKGLEVVERFGGAETGGPEKERKELRRMLEFVKRNGIQNLLVWKADRLARNVFDYSEILKQVKEGLTVHYVGEGRILNDKEGKMVSTILTAVAENERESIIERIKTALEEKRSRGEFTGTAPIGYLNNDGGVLIDPKKAEYIKLAFELYSEGTWGLKSLLEELTKRGLRNKNGGFIAMSTIRYLLKNPFYIGYFKGNPENGTRSLVKGNFEPLISDELFWKVQDVRRNRTHNGFQKVDHHFIYKGHAKCECGCSLTAYKSRAGGTVYYKCSHSKPGVKCNQKSLRSEVLDDFYEESVNKLFFDEEWEAWIVDQISCLNVEDEASLNRERKKLKSKLNEIKRKLETVYRDSLEGLVKKEIYLKIQEELELEERGIKARLDGLGNYNPDWRKDTIEFVKWMKNLKKSYIKADERFQREILDVLANRMVVNNGSYVMEWRMPFGIWAELMKSEGNEYQLMALKI